MNIRLFLAASLVLTMPFACALGTAQPTPPPGAQSGPPPNNDSPAHNWSQTHSWNRGDSHGGAAGHGRESAHSSDEHGSENSLLPFGMWWKNPDVVTRISLTSDQQKRIDDIFLQSRLQLVHLHASLKEQQMLLEPLLNASPFDEAKAIEQIDKIADTRADLEKTNARMLLTIRGVLSADQWSKLQSRDHNHHHQGGSQGNSGPQSTPKSE